MVDFDHWLVTRYNIPLSRCPSRSTDPDWLEHRERLFQTYCLPSVAWQTCQAFRWLLLVDRDTHPSHLEAIRAGHTTRSFDLLPVGPDWISELATYLTHETQRPLLVTSRMDNDDAIHPDYMRVLQDGVDGRSDEFLEMPAGLKLDESLQQAYAIRCRSGPFLTLVERPAGRPRTVYYCDHERAAEHAPLRELELQSAWLQVVHSRNILNRIQDGLVKVPCAKVEETFPGMSG